MSRGFVYIIQSEQTGRYYIGATTDPVARLVRHNTNQETATKYRGPWTMRLAYEYPSIAEAKGIEYRLKKLKRRDIIERIIAEGKIKMK